MLNQVTELIQRGIEAGLHRGAQVCVSQHGQTTQQLAIGEASPGQAMADDSIALWMSSGKPVTAVAIMQLVEQGELELDDAVGHYLPLFAAHGKSYITIGHLLTHTAGIRTARFKFPQDDWDSIIAAICDAQPEWEAGEEGGYHTQTTWFLLGELVHLVDGRTIDRYVREEIFLPLGMKDTWLGMPPETYRTYEQAGRLFDMPNTATGEAKPAPMTSFDWSTRPRPGGNCMGPIGELVRFYEMLLHGGAVPGQANDTRILKEETVAQMTHRQRADMLDHTFKQTVDWGLGLAINSAHHAPAAPGGKPAWHRIPYGYGPHASRETFGHGGAQSSIAFADPKHQLAAGIVFNGMPGEAKHQQRINPILEALYEDLGIS
eukprot:g14383.t1